MAGGFRRDAFHREEGIDPKTIERVEHEHGRPEIRRLLQKGPARDEKRDQIEPKKQEKPGADSHDQALDAVTGEEPGAKAKGNEDTGEGEGSPVEREKNGIRRPNEKRGDKEQSQQSGKHQAQGEKFPEDKRGARDWLHKEERPL